MTKERSYCSYCGKIISIKPEGEAIRDFCEDCDVYFYDNPLPVVSTIVSKEKNILLVERKNEPHKGKWCLPSGFAESGESIEAAALRELHEETGIRGKIIDFISVDSASSDFYGDLLFITFEAEWIDGKPIAGDDASDVQFFPIDNMPQLAFSSNAKAVEIFIRNRQEYWSILDSFSRSIKHDEVSVKGDFLSNQLISLIEKNADIIARRWIQEVRTNPSTPSYRDHDQQATFDRIMKILSQYSKWLGGSYTRLEIRNFYQQLGSDRKMEGFNLSEVLSALSLTRKHIWEFALSQRMWSKTIDIYMTLELERRMMLFFDRATYHISKGYE